MSQQNVEIVRAALDASMRGDWESAFRDVAPNFELDWSRTIGPAPGSIVEKRRSGCSFRRTRWNRGTSSKHLDLDDP